MLFFVLSQGATAYLCSVLRFLIKLSMQVLHSFFPAAWLPSNQCPRFGCHQQRHIPVPLLLAAALP
jgi:hypothetical protein